MRLLLVLCILCVCTPTSSAHVEGHPEWDAVLSQSRDVFNTSCCGTGDAYLVEFDDWRKVGRLYEVFIHGQWIKVEPHKLTTNMANPTGKAIVWYSTTVTGNSTDYKVIVTILCFKPLETY